MLVRACVRACVCVSECVWVCVCVLVDWLIEWLIHSFIHWFIDSLIHWIIDHWFIDSLWVRTLLHLQGNRGCSVQYKYNKDSSHTVLAVPFFTPSCMYMCVHLCTTPYSISYICISTYVCVWWYTYTYTVYVCCPSLCVCIDRMQKPSYLSVPLLN